MALQHYEAIILGGGAAGLMCAAVAGKRGLNVLVLEHNKRVGEKIRISGGGRCNFTNLHVGAENFHSGNPHFAKSALSRYPSSQFIALVESHGIPYHEKTLGQLFCDVSANAVIELLRKECQQGPVEFMTGFEARTIEHNGTDFTVGDGTQTFQARNLVVATGGLSIPKLGASDLGYRIASQFGIDMTPTKAGLVPFVLQRVEMQWLETLAGLSFEAVVSCGGVEFKGPVLITHRGLSGPAILQISSVWDSGLAVEIDMLPGVDLLEVAARDRSIQIQNLLARYLPQRLAAVWCERAGVRGSVAQMDTPSLRRLSDAVHKWRVIPLRTEGYEKAEVTVGGIDTRELSSKTMEANKRKGLYFIGEVVDVTGWLGGYNFQWAWASAVAAAESLQAEP